MDISFIPWVALGIVVLVWAVWWGRQQQPRDFRRTLEGQESVEAVDESVVEDTYVLAVLMGGRSRLLRTMLEEARHKDQIKIESGQLKGQKLKRTGVLGEVLSQVNSSDPVQALSDPKGALWAEARRAQHVLQRAGIWRSDERYADYLPLRRYGRRPHSAQRVLEIAILVIAFFTALVTAYLSLNVFVLFAAVPIMLIGLVVVISGEVANTQGGFRLTTPAGKKLVAALAKEKNPDEDPVRAVALKGRAGYPRYASKPFRHAAGTLAVGVREESKARAFAPKGEPDREVVENEDSMLDGFSQSGDGFGSEAER